MPSKDIFCNAPWYELHIYWDGSLGFCCQEDSKLYPPELASKYNLATMSIREWINSEPMQQVRKDIHGNTKLKICRRCYTEEHYGSTSRRYRSNQKSVIFTHINFSESYEQSPGFDKFEGRVAVDMPIDLHIDLGNYCNLTCKMCNPKASSSIAVQEVKWGITESAQYIGTDWTKDATVWNRTLKEIVSIPKLSNIHFMGGETIITPSFKQFIQALLDAGRTDIGISFVTNGTKYDHELIGMIKPFKRVGIEVSLESLTAHNHYQRQGTDTQEVLKHIDQYIHDGFEITLRPATSALTIGTYWTVLKYALEKKLTIKGQIAFKPDMIHPAVLPLVIRQTYQQAYRDLIAEYNLSDSVDIDYNESDPNQYRRTICNQANLVLELLEAPEKESSNLADLVAHCKKWDKVHGYNALELYPELAETFIKYGY